MNKKFLISCLLLGVLLSTTGCGSSDLTVTNFAYGRNDEKSYVQAEVWNPSTGMTSEERISFVCYTEDGLSSVIFSTISPLLPSAKQAVNFIVYGRVKHCRMR